nr:MAG: RNA replicase beta chain [Sanya fiers-like virus 52]
MKSLTLPSDVTRIALSVYEGLGTPFSTFLAERLRAGDWEAISTVKLDPRAYSVTDAAQYQRDAVAAGLLKKLQQLPTKVDRKQAAIEKWWSGERSCFRTNERLTRYLPEFRNSTDRSPLVEELLSSIRSEVRRLIGPKPATLQQGRFGPGSTFSDRAGRSTVPDKMSSDPTLTRNAIWYLPQWLSTQWGADVASRCGEMVFVPGNRFSTVPKTSQTDRAIAAEPSINVFYQLALGRELRTRLKKCGWNLDTAQDTHRLIAKESSVSREYCTLDLSNASDTVAYNLVRLLLPHAWFNLLDSLRSPKTKIQGKWVVLEKFSSMGNGFTFELETVIFAAVASVISRKCGHQGLLGKDTFVFGDDIIVKDDVARPLKLCLEFLGFELNEEKSFFGETPFRESCGADYFAGKPARPFYLKELPVGPQGYIAFANGLRAAAEQLDPNGLGCLSRAWFHILDQIPVDVRRCRGPKALGDIVIHDLESKWTVRWHRGIRYIKCYRPWRYRKVAFACFRPSVVLACAVYGTGNEGTPRNGFVPRIEGLIPRDGVLSYKIGRVAYS